MPEVEVIDMRRELDSGNRSIFSSALASALKQCVERGEQAMLLMNRRGYNSFISCRACGHVMKCPNCDVAMTYHVSGGDGMLHCHYCGYQVAPPQKCPKCGSSYIRYFGAGTQKVEEELHKLLPGVPWFAWTLTRPPARMVTRSCWTSFVPVERRCLWARR